MRHQVEDSERPVGDLYITRRADVEEVPSMLTAQDFALLWDPCASGAAPWTVGEILAAAWSVPRVALSDLHPRRAGVREMNYLTAPRPRINGPVLQVSNPPYYLIDEWLSHWRKTALPGDACIWALAYDTFPVQTDRAQDLCRAILQPNHRLAFHLTEHEGDPVNKLPLPLNLCHFDIIVAGVTLPRSEEPLLLKPKLGPVYQIGGCPVRNLYGFRAPQPLRLLGRERLLADRRVVVPRLGTAIGLTRTMGLAPLCLPLRLLSQRGRPGPVELESVDQLEPAPVWLAYEYRSKRAFASFVGALCDGTVARRVKGAFTIRVAQGPELAPVDDGLAAVDHPDGTATCPEAPLASAVLVPHSGPIIRAYAARGHVVLVTSTVREDGTVDLYRVA